MRVLEKLGMTQEGVRRSHGIRPGNRFDQAVFGVLREEWDETALRSAKRGRGAVTSYRAPT